MNGNIVAAMVFQHYSIFIKNGRAVTYIFTMQGVYIIESNKNGAAFYELSLGRYDSDRDYLRDGDRHLEEVSEAAIQSSKEAVSLCVVMAGVTALWVGMMRIAEKSGLLEAMEQRMQPVLNFLFPEIPGITRRGNRLQRICWRMSWDSAGPRHRQG